MKKKYLILICLLLVLALSAGYANGIKEKDDKEKLNDLANSMSEIISGEDQYSDEIIAKVDNYLISREEFDVRIASNKVVGKSADAAWDEMVLLAYENSFAAEHGILPDKKTIMDFALAEMSDAEKDKEVIEIYDAFASGLGLERKEYWLEYRTKYDFRFYLVRKSIEAYLEENSMEPLNVKNAEIEIIDSDYLKEKGVTIR